MWRRPRHRDGAKTSKVNWQSGDFWGRSQLSLSYLTARLSNGSFTETNTAEYRHLRRRLQYHGYDYHQRIFNRHNAFCLSHCNRGWLFTGTCSWIFSFRLFSIYEDRDDDDDDDKYDSYTVWLYCRTSLWCKRLLRGLRVPRRLAFRATPIVLHNHIMNVTVVHYQIRRVHCRLERLQWPEGPHRLPESPQTSETANFISVH